MRVTKGRALWPRDAAARKVVDDVGFGPGYTRFTHRVGHGIGVDEHEWPYLVKGNAQPLETNMTHPMSQAST